MQLTILLTALSAAAVAGMLPAAAESAEKPHTFCNPINIPYCFSEGSPSRREAADPTMILFKGEYWLFASKSEGYWHTKDFIHWQLVVPETLPMEAYAPTVLELNGKLYWAAFNTPVFESDDPLTGRWKQVSETSMRGDPDLFLDDDGRVYLYSGCDNGGPILGQELDPKNRFKFLGEAVALIRGDIPNHGWEIRAQPSDKPPFNSKDCWIEGAWMNKHNGRYYLQYSAPGTEFKSYGDGVYVSNHPLGPFTYEPYSPFSFKPGGFIGGAGHSSTFQDTRGNLWHIATMVISVRHPFERRLGVFPARFTPDGQLACDTSFGDYPQFLPGNDRDHSKGDSPGWMLLSYRKAATSSSTLPGHAIEAAFDEEIRTWWSAKTGDPAEWLQVDLGKKCRVNAAQINFADEGSTQLHRLHDGYGYTLELSEDGKKWITAIDRRSDKPDAPHDYAELPHPVLARYARLTNQHTPAGACFSVSGLRLFGSGLGHAPGIVSGVQAVRDASDSRQATIHWEPVPGADGYIVRYGIAQDKLFSSYQVWGEGPLQIHTLNRGVHYFFCVDSYNDSGVTRGKTVLEVKP